MCVAHRIVLVIWRADGTVTMEMCITQVRKGEGKPGNEATITLIRVLLAAAIIDYINADNYSHLSILYLKMHVNNQAWPHALSYPKRHVYS